jgi:transposase
LVARRGKKRAIAAVAHSVLGSAYYHELSDRQPYHELGGDYFDRRKKETKVSYLIRRLEKLTGGSVSIGIPPTSA